MLACAADAVADVVAQVETLGHRGVGGHARPDHDPSRTGHHEATRTVRVIDIDTDIDGTVQ
jgi:hypothetical protein